MAQTVDTSLEAQVADLQAVVRSLRATNWTDLASVVNAAGASVPLSALAFGSVAETDNATVEMWGPANATPGGVGWFGGGPYVHVLVTGGRLRVDVAGALTASGNKCSAYYSYVVLGPGTEPVIQPDTVVAPAYDRSVECQHSGSGMDARLAASSFGTHTDLLPGWYTVASRYALSYSGSTAAPFGSVQNRRITATPY